LERKKKPGVLVLQEWWGVNEQIKNTASRVANAGFRVMVIDFFRGKVAHFSERDEASHLFNTLDWEDSIHDIQAATNYLTQEGSPKVGCMGFCMGGALSLVALSKTKGLSCGAVFYGLPSDTLFTPNSVKAPLIGHWPALDLWCTPAKVAELEKKLTEATVPHTFYNYEGVDHAFCNDKRPEVYNATACQTAFDRTFTFFGSTLLK